MEKASIIEKIIEYKLKEYVRGMRIDKEWRKKMLNFLWPILIIISFLFSLINGSIENINNSIFESIDKVINITITLAGTMCLWCGLMEIVKNTSLINKLKRLLRPFLNWLFPEVKNDEEAMENISINTIANIFGLGNASTPAGIKAMESLQKINNDKKSLSNSMMTLIVLNTASIEIIPTTVIAIRSSLNSQNPTDIIVPLWISTIVGTLTGIIVTKLIIKRSKNK